MTRKRRILLLFSIIGILLIVSMSALFSSSDLVTNSLSVSRFDIELLEQHWTFNHDTAVPNEEIPKDPKIRNNGETGAYVFLEVIIPYYSHIHYETDNEGSLEWGGNIPSVKFIDSNGNMADDSENLFAQNVNDGWILIEEQHLPEEGQTEPETHIYIYAYAKKTGAETYEMQVLSEKSETPELFNAVKLFNARERSKIPMDDEEDICGKTITVDVYAHGIQAEHLKGTDVTTTDPLEIWNMISLQKTVG